MHATIVCLRTQKPDKPELVITIAGERDNRVIPLTFDQMRLIASQAVEIVTAWPHPSK